LAFGLKSLLLINKDEYEIHLYGRHCNWEVRPLQNVPFCQISASDSDFNSRNTKCMPAVKIFVFLEL